MADVITERGGTPEMSKEDMEKLESRRQMQL